uniref:Pre-mRNA-splicing factor SLU7 n=1 Tax=Romanomermis culicivorax TaxID=13658 RepID=A0A915HD99_ROMCU
MYKEIVKQSISHGKGFALENGIEETYFVVLADCHFYFSPAITVIIRFKKMAAFTPNVAPSTILRAKLASNKNEKGGVDDDQPKRQSKQEFRRQKELEEGRKAGTEPAMTDVETGRDINPHIPHYIANAPWYLNATGPTLKHQRPHPERQTVFSEIYEMAQKGITSRVATKFRAGACENCGAMTHKKKDCFERPRKIGARYTNQDIAPDEFLPNDLTQKYDAKRDRWSGFDPREHTKVIEEYNRLEEARKIIKTAELLEKSDQETCVNDIQHDEHSKNDIDEDKYAEDASMPGVKVDVDSHTKITVRNLRIREDTAKYLHNLDPESAYYDPKSRAMREDPFKNLPAEKRPQNVAFQGDNFRRFTGEVRDAERSQVFAWEADGKGLDVHALAEPTKLEALHSILDKYGGKEHVLLDDQTKKLIYQAQGDSYTEYNRKGELIKGQEKPVVRSRYAEDRMINNHTAIFGSYWSKGRWGYKCCHSFVKNSYCLGEDGRLADDDGKEIKQEKNELNEKERTSKEGESKKSSSSSSESSDFDSASSDVDTSTEQNASNQKRMDRKRRRRVEKVG